MSLCPQTKSVTTLTGELGSRSAATTDHASQRRFAGEWGSVSVASCRLYCLLCTCNTRPAGALFGLPALWMKVLLTLFW